MWRIQGHSNPPFQTFLQPASMVYSVHGSGMLALAVPNSASAAVVSSAVRTPRTFLSLRPFLVSCKAGNKHPLATRPCHNCLPCQIILSGRGAGLPRQHSPFRFPCLFHWSTSPHSFLSPLEITFLWLCRWSVLGGFVWFLF